MAAPIELDLFQAVEFVSENWEWLATVGVILIGALTAKQRTAIKDRDDNRCQADGIIPHKHGGNLQVHHIKLQSWMYAHDIDPDFEDNVVTVCQEAHGRIHPQLDEAYQRYREGDKEAFKKMAQEEQEDAKKDRITWNDRWDTQLQTRAMQNTDKKKKKGWFFPRKKGEQSEEE